MKFDVYIDEKGHFITAMDLGDKGYEGMTLKQFSDILLRGGDSVEAIGVLAQINFEHNQLSLDALHQIHSVVRSALKERNKGRA